LVIRQFPGSGIVLDTNGGNFVEGNYIGTDVTGTLDKGNGGNGVEIVNSAGNVIGGTTVGAGNLVSGNSGEGVFVGGPTSKANLIAGNFIGTNAAGTGALGNSASGIYIRRAGGNIVRNNLVSGNTGFAGVAICGAATFCGGGNGDSGSPSDAAGNIVQANVIGRAVNNSGPLGNTGFGVSIDGAPDNAIGEGAAGLGNVIAHNSRGVIVFNAGAIGNRVRGNSIDLNQGLGIDLGNNGVTNNDFGDADTGPNNYQNFPVLTSVIGGNALTVAATLNSLASTAAVIDFYNSPTCNALGHGEGQTWLGAMTLPTNVDGNLSLTASLAQVPANTFVSATATTADGTSEFSSCALVPAGVVEWPTSQDGNGHFYQYVRQPGLSWTEASAAASQMSYNGWSGHLVSIAYGSENAFVNALRNGGDMRAWIGLSDPNGIAEGSWRWITGETFDYSNWGPGEPNNLGTEFWVEMFADGTWNNNVVKDLSFPSQGYIVEFEPPPPPPPSAGTIASVSPSTGTSTGVPVNGFMVVRGTGFPSPTTGVAIVSNGGTTMSGFVLQSPSTASAYWVRLPAAFPLGSATIQLYDPSTAGVSNAFPITVAAVPGTPIITNVLNSDFLATTTVSPGSPIYVQADGIDTAGSVIRFQQGNSVTDVASDQTNTGSNIGVAALVTAPAGLAPGTVSVSIRQGPSEFSAPVSLTVPPQ
jgi:hypothetical protein